MSKSHFIIIVGSAISLLGIGNPGTESLFKIESSRFSQNYEISHIHDDLVSLTDKITRSSKLFRITPSDLTLSPQTQIIDLINEDTIQYSNRYIYHDRIPITGLQGAYPPICADLNGNDKLDIIGTYLPPEDRDTAMVAIVELQDDEKFTMIKIYNDPPVIRPIPLTNLFSRDKFEINLQAHGGGEFYNYVSDTSASYPDSINFMYVLWEKTGGPSHERITDADNDGITDLLHIGQEQASPAGQKVFVAEYDSVQNNFVKRFSHLAITYRVWGLAYGDFDADGHIEFLTGSIDGDVFVYENIANDEYAPIFHDTISTPNAYLVCATNDIDRNGKTEFFVGGSSYYGEVGGTKVYWFEADGNNYYSIKYTFFLAGTGVLGNTEMFNFDVDADGIDDLVFCFSATVVILKWNQNGYFDLVYLDWVEDWNNEIHSVSIYDIYNTGNPDLIVGYINGKEPISFYSKIYKSNLISSIDRRNNSSIPNEYRLFQNYPNPFNGTTRIRFQLNSQQKVSLIIYDITGKEVKEILNSHFLSPGIHEYTWDGRNSTGEEVGSGIYIISLIADNYNISRKMVLIK